MAAEKSSDATYFSFDSKFEYLNFEKPLKENIKPELIKLKADLQDFMCLKVLSLINVIKENRAEKIKVEDIKTAAFEKLNQICNSGFSSDSMKNQNFDRCGSFLMILLEIERLAFELAENLTIYSIFNGSEFDDIRNLIR
uniref:Uncharacterized protein n=1 Tax=Panagrolaimus sp. PS1159 TaxID=55785 RepID=A0AC35FBG9_9BILA